MKNFEFLTVSSTPFPSCHPSPAHTQFVVQLKNQYPVFEALWHWAASLMMWELIMLSLERSA